MAIHYSANQEGVACGRSGASLEMTQVEAEVSCKLCLRSLEKKAVEPVRKTPSLADLRAAAKAEKAAAAEAAAAVEAKPSRTTPVEKVAADKAASTPSKKSARAEWQARLAQLPGRNRLPRGASRQSFI
ncbi:hypothetical protein WG219_21620 [Ectopseudomonas mendocina]|uniref:Uncharacterized protein n=1 Tax=Ectopseudomonas mendocina TaxID=300 RepID=A0ABZ2RFR7_ECTME